VEGLEEETTYQVTVVAVVGDRDAATSNVITATTTD
jgi:hypothetical protein